MDPQQRLLLELVWEALESAGVPPSSLAGEEVGVFVGASSSDYLYRFISDPLSVDTQMMTGNTLSIIANRISYQFDFKGPSLTVDTACSSSLVALTQACEAIASGRLKRAIVAGVSLLSAPYPFIGFSAAHMLSPTGLCRAFDVAGDGYVRAEGAVALLIEATDGVDGFGDIVAWGANSDGRTNGLSLPSSETQSALLRHVYDTFGIDAEALAFVEAHGTGTRVGDPAEAFAIGDALGSRRHAPLPIGSAKSNFGHLEPASGLVGLLKAALALRYEKLPATLHFVTPNPDIPFASLNLAVAAQPVALDTGRTPLAGVSSFGFGGANAHVVLRAQPTCDVRPRAVSPAPIIISAQSEKALRAIAGAYREQLSSDESQLAPIANSAAYTRDMLQRRAIVHSRSAPQALEALDALANGRPHPDVTVGRALSGNGAVLFTFSGNGSQWAGMGLDALEKDTIFARAIDQVDEILAPLTGWSTREALHSPDLAEMLKSARLAQPLLFAIQVGVVEALAAQGLMPDLVVGHSVGEVAAAWCAGALTLADAARVIDARSRAQELLRGAGGMAAMNVSPEDVLAALASAGSSCEGVEIAAYNAPSSVTICGPYPKLDAFLKNARARRWAFRRLTVDYPYHHALLEPTREALLSELAELAPRESKTVFVSSVTGNQLPGAELDADYWWRNARQPVQFAPALLACLEHRPAVALEIGPAPVLGGYITAAASEAGRSIKALATLRREGSDRSHSPLVAVVADALAAGARVDSKLYFGARAPSAVALPHYSWDRSTFKHLPSREAHSDFALRRHPLLGAPIRLDETIFYNHIDVERFPWLADHRAGGAVVVPGAAIVEIALAAAREALGEGPIELRDCEIYRPLPLEAGVVRETRVEVDRPERLIDFYSRRRGSDGEWIHHARASFSAARPSFAVIGRRALRNSGKAKSSLKASDVYGLAAAMQLDYGPAFRPILGVDLLDDNTASVRLETSATADEPFLLDPILLDGGLQGGLCLPALGAVHGKTFLPTRFERVRVLQPGRNIAVCDVFLKRADSHSALADIVYRDHDGVVVAEMIGGRSMAVRLKGGERPILAYRQALVGIRPRRNGPPRSVAAQNFSAPRQPRVRPDGLANLALSALHAALFALFGELAFDPDLPRSSERAADVDGAKLSPLLARLAEAGLAHRSGQIWRLDPSDNFSGLLCNFLAQEPRRAVEATFLSAAADCCANLLRKSPEAPFSDSLFNSLTSRSVASSEIREVQARFVAQFVAATEPSTALRVLIVGANDAALVRAILAEVDPAKGGIWVVDADITRRTSLVEKFSTAPHLRVVDVPETPALAFNLAIWANPRFLLPGVSPVWLRERLASDGRLSVIEWSGDAFADLVGLAAQSLGMNSTSETPLSEWLNAADMEIVDANNANGLTSIVAQKSVPPTPDESVARLRIALAGTSAECLTFAQELREELAALGVSEAVEGEAKTVLYLGCSNPPRENSEAWIASRCLEIRDLVLSQTRLGQIVILAPGALRGLLGTEGGNAAAHAVLGFARVCVNEFPGCDLRVLDCTTDGQGLQALARELVAPSEERELLLNGNAGFGLRVFADAMGVRHSLESDRLCTTQLQAPNQGSVDKVVWACADRRAPGPDEIEIEVGATGLNFRDVMWALGALPPEALEDGFAGPTLGLECAGVVTRVGVRVDSFKAGEKCMAFAPHSFSSHVTVSARAAAPLPPEMTCEAAATIPVCFITVHYSLTNLARVRAGETVLVHGGAGGVGLAAVQLAKSLGARVIATAGQHEKRVLLRNLGVEHVFSSRSLTFADDVMAATNGMGVDVIINSLAGEAMERSIRCLKPFGRFVELGKTDFFANTRVGLRPFSKNLSYFGVDADQLMSGCPDLAMQMLNEVAALFRAGQLSPLPYNLFDGEDVVDALRLMQRSQHIGKIVVRPTRANAQELRPNLLQLRQDSAYLVVGGLGGFGLALAERLAARGAGKLVLVGRKPPSSSVEARLNKMRRSGLEIVVRQADCADSEALARLVGEVTADGKSVRGVFHAAMTLDDRLAPNLDAESMRSVMRSKVSIADNLDGLFRGPQLDHFVLFSSATTVIGNPGQGNYVAANAYLEELARLRRCAGLPALAIAWAPIADVGYLASDDRRARIAAHRLERHSISCAAALDALEKIIATDDGSVEAAVVGVGRFDFEFMRRDHAILSSTTFTKLGGASDADGPARSDPSGLAEMLCGLSRSEARLRIVEMLTKEIARILRLPAEQVDPERPLPELGVDSLMGVELRLAAEERLGLEIPLLAIGAAGSIMDLAERCLQELKAS